MQISLLFVCILGTFILPFLSAKAIEYEEAIYGEEPDYAPLEDEEGYPASVYDEAPAQYSQLPKDVVKKFGMISGVYAVNHSHVYVFHRANRKWNEDSFDKENVFTKQAEGPIKENTIALLVDGVIKMEAGSGLFYMPHSITVDNEGNVWTSDVALHQVFKFAKDDLTKPVLTLGEKFKPGSDSSHFCKPTDIKVASNGFFFVADGYCNSRVLKFHANGTHADTLGAEIEMRVPHSLGLWEKENLLFVADRENNRILVLDACLGAPETCGYTLQDTVLDSEVYALDINPDKEQVFAFVLADPVSYVAVLDAWTLKEQAILYGPENQGFGYGHALTNIPFLNGTNSGFVLASLLKDCMGEACPLDAVETSKTLGNGAIFMVKNL